MNILSWFTHPRFVLNLYEFLLLSTKYILENVGNQTIAVAIDFHSIFFHTMEVNGYQQLFGYQKYSKYFILCSAEERNNRLGTIWEWVNHDKIMSFLGELSL